MKNIVRAIVVVMGLSIIIYALVSFYQTKTAKAAILSWSLLDSWPNQKVETKLTIKGNSFSREFYYSIQFPSNEELEKWVNSNSIFRKITPTKTDDESVYSIKGTNAAFCEIRIQHKMHSVLIHTYWS